MVWDNIFQRLALMNTLTLSVAERIIYSSISKGEQLYHKQLGLFSISFYLKIRTCNVVTYSYDNIFWKAIMTLKNFTKISLVIFKPQARQLNQYCMFIPCPFFSSEFLIPRISYLILPIRLWHIFCFSRLNDGARPETD